MCVQTSWEASSHIKMIEHDKSGPFKVGEMLKRKGTDEQGEKHYLRTC